MSYSWHCICLENSTWWYSYAAGRKNHTMLRRRYFMDQKGFKKILAGLSITTLVAGTTLMGVGFPEPAQAA